MSSYSKLIIFIVVLLAISAVVLFMDSSTDNMNDAMPDINNGIVDGDSEYNEAVDLVNNKNFYQSKQKADSAGNNYNRSLIRLHEVQNNFSSDIHGVHKDYINAVIKEVELKLKAVDLLKEAIDCFEVNSNYTGSNYGFEANDAMDQAVEYQNERNSIVEDNPKLFK